MVTALPAQRSTSAPQQRRVRRGAAYSGEVSSNLPERPRRLEVFAEEGDFNEWEIRQGVRDVCNVLGFLLPALGEQVSGIGGRPAIDHARSAFHAGPPELIDEFDRF